MTRLSALLARFPDRELILHRLYLQDSGFRAICEDYEEARMSERRWREAGAVRRAEDYSQIATELEGEIQRVLVGNATLRRRQS